MQCGVHSYTRALPPQNTASGRPFRPFRAGSAAVSEQAAATTAAERQQLDVPAGSTDNLSTHRRGLLQGLLGSAALTSLPPPEATAATAQEAAGGATTTAANPHPSCSAANASAEGNAEAAAAGTAGSGGGSSSSCLQSCHRAAAAARDPAVNRGCATRQPARQQLAGLIPPRQVDLSVEVLRAKAALEQCSTQLEKHRLLVSLKETNRAAFIALLQQDLEVLLPLVYTPVIAEACLHWDTLLPRPLGLYVTPADDPSELLAHWPSQEVKVAVITDGERILGLGDLGAHGMGIPTGKCNVYAAAGTPPDWLLPITVDVGTNNTALRADPLYVGQPQPRLRGPEYFNTMEGVVKALQQRFGDRVVVHFEDLAVGNAVEMLQRTAALGLPTFNDDIQCTAAVALAALLGATRIPGVLPLQSQTFCFFGAGQANLGVAQLLVRALQQQGLSEGAAKGRIWLVDSKGLITTDRTDLTPLKAAFAQDSSRGAAAYNSSSSRSSSSRSSSSSSSSSSRRRPSQAEVIQQLTGIVEAVQPTALIGAAAVSGAFGQPVLEALLKSTRAAGGPSSRPVVFALSNPTEQAEVSFEQALQWTGGAAVFASGSPFSPITTAAGKTLRPAQANNCFIFPGLAQGILLSNSIQRVDDGLLLVAADAVAGLLSAQEVKEECVLPSISRLPEVTAQLAAVVARSG